MAIRQSIKELIGNTPLVQLNRYAAKRGLGANILAKIEYFNPAGSVKDRVGFAMLDAAEKPANSTAKPSSLNRPAETPVSVWPLRPPQEDFASF